MHFAQSAELECEGVRCRRHARIAADEIRRNQRIESGRAGELRDEQRLDQRSVQVQRLTELRDQGLTRHERNHLGEHGLHTGVGRLIHGEQFFRLV